MKFRQIDAQRIWQGECPALAIFRKAFQEDCEGDAAMFLRVYGWTQAALTRAIEESSNTGTNPHAKRLGCENPKGS